MGSDGDWFLCEGLSPVGRVKKIHVHCSLISHLNHANSTHQPHLNISHRRAGYPQGLRWVFCIVLQASPGRPMARACKKQAKTAARATARTWPMFLMTRSGSGSNPRRRVTPRQSGRAGGAPGYLSISRDWGFGSGWHSVGRLHATLCRSLQQFRTLAQLPCRDSTDSIRALIGTTHAPARDSGRDSQRCYHQPGTGSLDGGLTSRRLLVDRCSSGPRRCLCVTEGRCSSDPSSSGSYHPEQIFEELGRFFSPGHA